MVWLVVPLAYVLYFYRLGAVGLVGPDEPRYASIARAMAQSGDWITPRLWGQPWFEKPPLLYWMSAAGFRLGWGPELGPRLPVAVLAVGFLIFFWWIVRREFSGRAAWFAVLILGTCGEWLGYCQVAVTDVPLTVTFSAAMLLLLPWIARRETRYLPAAGALMGLAVLAKGLVPLALAAPVIPFLWFSQKPAGRPAVPWKGRLTVGLILFLSIAAPWYVACYLRNGSAFLNDFFWKQHFERVVSGSLMHGQPWWFYLPVYAAAFLPWSPLLLLLARRGAYRDPRRMFLLAWVLFGLVFFSVALNKLPGYMLPLLPPAALLAALALDEASHAGAWLAVSAALLAAFPIAAPMLPAALAAGLSKAPHPTFHLVWLVPGVVAAAAWILERRGRRLAAVWAIAAGAAAGMVYVKQTALPQVDGLASARSLWREVAPRAGETCLDQMDRAWRYGLNYYSANSLPECAAQPRRFSVRQSPGGPPYVAPSENGPVDPVSPSVVISPFRY